MTFNCSGESYCSEDEKATISVFFEGKESAKFISKNSPVCVKEEKINLQSNKRIFYFWAENYSNDGSSRITFEHYACGNNAYYQPNPELINNGAYLIVDDRLQVGEDYFYWQYQHDSGGTRRFLEVVDSIPAGASGDFSQCDLDGCEITIFDKDGGQLYKDKGKSPCKVEVACGDACPEGYLKCSSNKYPGYCCLPCQQTANKIRALGDKL